MGLEVDARAVSNSAPRRDLRAHLGVQCQDVVYLQKMTNRDGPLCRQPRQLTACGNHPYLSSLGCKQPVGTELLVEGIGNLASLLQMRVI